MKSKIPPKTTQRALAIAACMGAALKSLELKTLKEIRLTAHINNAMQVYSRKSIESYTKVNEDVAEIWDRLGKKNKNIIPQDRIDILVQYMGYILPENEYKAFLAMSPYQCDSEISNKDLRVICTACIGLSKEINELFNTKTNTSTFIIKKVKKSKKIRIKPKSKEQIKHEQKVEQTKQNKERRTNTLRERIAAAKKNKAKKEQDAFDSSRSL